MGFCFCDGFGLHILRKLLWFAVFLAMVVYTMNTKGSFELTSILPVPIVFAFILCAYEKARKKQK
jgi:hypothetical protein